MNPLLDRIHEKRYFSYFVKREVLSPDLLRTVLVVFNWEQFSAEDNRMFNLLIFFKAKLRTNSFLLFLRFLNFFLS